MWGGKVRRKKSILRQNPSLRWRETEMAMVGKKDDRSENELTKKSKAPVSFPTGAVDFFFWRFFLQRILSVAGWPSCSEFGKLGRVADLRDNPGLWSKRS